MALAAGLYAWFGFYEPEAVSLQAIADVGFSYTALYWSDEFGDVRRTLETARALGLTVLYGHLPYQGLNALWYDGASGDRFQTRLEALIERAAEWDLKTLVIHPTEGHVPVAISQVGLRRFARLFRRADDVGVTLAVENVEQPAPFFCLVDRFSAALCYDSGHNHVARSAHGDLLTRYPGRVVTVHLHDNDGRSDQHAVPFDGTIDWPTLLQTLRQNGYSGPLTLETIARPEETDDRDGYLTRVRDAALKLIAWDEALSRVSPSVPGAYRA